MLMPAELKECVTWFTLFFYLLKVGYNCAKFHHCMICMTDFTEVGLFGCPPICEQPRQCPPWIVLKEHLQPYIWVTPSLFNEATCSNLVFSRVPCFFEISNSRHPFLKDIVLIHDSSCSHRFIEWPFFYYKRAIVATHSF